VPYEGWLRIDATERAASPSNRCRLKIADRAGMLAIAHTAGVQP
jgi:hypothetical protein